VICGRRDIEALILSACGQGAPSSSSSETAPDYNSASKSEAANPSSLSIDYEKFTLENGLDVILQVDRRTARSRGGRVLRISLNIWPLTIVRMYRAAGTAKPFLIGADSATAAHGRTALDKILWIDSDRLGYMINTVTTAALEREKQVVKNEKRQRVDNAAYGYTGEVIRTALYPEGHPYSWTVIGSLPDLQAATLADLQDFHQDWYGPNNVTLSIVGDIDIAETKKKVKLWFGEIPRGRDVEKPAPQPVTLEATKNLWFEDNFAKLPELRLTFPTVEDYHADEQALDLLAQILGGCAQNQARI